MFKRLSRCPDLKWRRNAQASLYRRCFCGIQALFLRPVDAAIAAIEGYHTPHGPTVMVSNQVDGPDVQRRVMEIGSAFDDIVDHPIMGRAEPLHRYLFMVYVDEKGMTLLLRRRSRN